MSERDLNLALDTIDQDLCDTEYSEDLDEDLIDETDQIFDELDEESVIKYKNGVNPDLIDDEDTDSFDDDDIYDKFVIF